jgi:hypothetical protein
MSTTLTFTLEKKAKSAGGDKYVCTTQSEFNIYFPQTISRKGSSTPYESLQVIINAPSSSNTVGDGGNNGNNGSENK